MTPVTENVAARIRAALQRGLPLAARPFMDLADAVGCREEDVFAELTRLRAAGLVRRFGAVFDTRRLGYRSVLCAASVAPEACAAAAATLVPLAGVTHCYAREPLEPQAGMPNLWFTLSEPADVFAAMQDEVRMRLAPFADRPVRFLPALRRYKVDVVFGAATRAREESVEDDLGPITGRDRAVIAALQGDTEVRSDYFAALAKKVGLPEWDLLSILELWRRNGRLKRIGLLLAHRQAGYVANGMCCWRVQGDTTAAGRALAARSEVTHCYARPAVPEFDYGLFAMIHARSTAEAQGVFAELSATVAATQEGETPAAVMLVSTVEYKKTSMTFFVSHEGGS